MSDFKETCIWMSYRYAIGRKTIASLMHAEDIANHMEWMPMDRWAFTDNPQKDAVECFVKHKWHWVKLANLFLQKRRTVTTEFNGKVETRKMYEWWDVRVRMSDITLEKRYSTEDGYMRGWYIGQEYIKSVL